MLKQKGGHVNRGCGRERGRGNRGRYRYRDRNRSGVASLDTDPDTDPDGIPILMKLRENAGSPLPVFPSPRLGERGWGEGIFAENIDRLTPSLRYHNHGISSVMVAA